MTAVDFVAYSYGTATVLELLWTGLSLAGCVITARLLRECYLDRDALVRSPLFVPNGARHLVAEMNIGMMSNILSIQLLFLVAGGVACFTPPASGAQPTPYSVVLALVFITANGILTYASYRSGRGRAALLKVLRVRRADGEMPP